MIADPSLPIAIIGAGPVGLAAALHVLERGLTPLLLEAGPTIAANIAAWGHVRLFTPWRYAVDKLAVAHLRPTGWHHPDPDIAPTGRELIESYLAPLAALPALAPHLRLNHRVLSISRQGIDKMTTKSRANAPFALEVQTADGSRQRLLARAVIDASGTWATPNPLGADGRLALGEAQAGDRIAYGIPDVLGSARSRYQGRHVVVVGAGHSAANALLDLAELPATRITWVLRSPLPQHPRLFGGGSADALPARGQLGSDVQSLAASGVITIADSFRIAALERTDNGLRLIATDGQHLDAIDEIICATGPRPDLELTRELRLSIDPAVECVTALAPLIDPNEHSCGTVRPHGAQELAHAEPDFFTVGVKSYGRAPTFLLATGYEQVRSVAAWLAGDHEAALRVELDLPKTGVCNAPTASARQGCCG